jgi:hypothetical protein
MFLLALNRDNAVPGGFSVWNGGRWIDSNYRGMADGQWHHVAITYDGAAIRLYRDGLLDVTHPGATSYALTTWPLHFGRFATANIGWYFGGQMDDIRLYNRALAEIEISPLIACGTAPAPAPFPLPAEGVTQPSRRLRLDPAQRQADGHFRLVAREINEEHVDFETWARLKVFTTSDLSLPLREWHELQVPPRLGDRAVYWDDTVSASAPQRFYILIEAPE